MFINVDTPEQCKELPVDSFAEGLYQELKKGKIGEKSLGETRTFFVDRTGGKDLIFTAKAGTEGALQINSLQLVNHRTVHEGDFLKDLCVQIFDEIEVLSVDAPYREAAEVVLHFLITASHYEKDESIERLRAIVKVTESYLLSKPDSRPTPEKFEALIEKIKAYPATKAARIASETPPAVIFAAASSEAASEPASASKPLGSRLSP